MPPYRPIVDRIYDHIKVCPITECWIWTGAVATNGYGAIRVNRKTRRAHRIAYEALVGPVPSGLDLDHLCRNRACVNPKHLEPATRSINCSRGECGKIQGDRQKAKTHCVNGHPYSGDNLIVRGDGSRACKQCRNASFKRWYWSKGRGGRNAVA